MTEPRIVWHYTTGLLWDAIRADGEVVPATANVPPGERPCVWFSAHPIFEPTARKGLVNRSSGERRTATIEETADYGRGLYRIGVTREVAKFDFGAYARMSRAKPRMVRALQAEGKRQDADHRQWFVSFASVPRSQWSTVERWESGVWVNVPPEEWTH